MSSIRLCLKEILEQRGITRYELSQRTGIRYQIIDNYYKNKVIRYDSALLLKMCVALDCGIEDLIEVIR
ncbi:MAG TPA: helix-turn-helix transcriptional regulator [Candidatus Agathobaculum stercoravium]|nr:helix-turn-helix transcriptional regulator [Candidatus Agathobaculum stercoravium]